MLNVFPNIHQKIKSIILQLYKYQKDLGKDKPLNHIPIFSTEDRNVLMANEDNKRIAIQDYLTWLSCNYNLNIELSKDFTGKDLSKYTRDELCNSKPLQKLISTKKQGFGDWSLLLFALFALSGCSMVSTSSKKSHLTIIYTMSNGTSWKVGDPEPNWEVIIKVSDILLQHCNVNRQTNYIPWDLSCNKNINNLSALTVQYAVIPWNRMQANAMGGYDAYVQFQAQSLPPSAWRTYTLYPQQIIEQAKHIPPSDKPASQKPKHLKTTLTLTLYIDGNGNITQEIKKEYVKVGNPYA